MGGFSQKEAARGEKPAGAGWNAALVAELDGQGRLRYRFVYATKPHVPDYLRAYNPATGAPTGTYVLVTDHLGSVRLVVNAADGTIRQRMDHDEFGRVTEDFIAPGWEPIPFGFAGGLYDRDTGLVRFGARDYDPQTGRWTAKDPILFEGGDTNLFAYCGNDPINCTDSLGTGPIGILCKLGKYLSNVREGTHAYDRFKELLREQQQIEEEIKKFDECPPEDDVEAAEKARALRERARYNKNQQIKEAGSRLAAFLLGLCGFGPSGD